MEPEEWFMARFRAYEKHPVRRRLEMTAKDRISRFETEHVMEADMLRYAGTFYHEATVLLMKSVRKK